MAVVNTLATGVSNADALPRKNNPALLIGGRVRKIAATVEKAAADSNTSKYRLGRVHSSWSIHSIRLFSDAITAGTAYDVGLYAPAADGGAAVDDDCYASAVDLSSAHAGTELAFEARDKADVENQVWEDAGQSADPNTFYDLVLTADTAGTDAATLSVVIEYTDGS